MAAVSKINAKKFELSNPKRKKRLMDLFGPDKKKISDNEPLASRMRPRTLDDFLGQGHIMGDGKLLRRIIESDKMTS